jgi:broad specificity phosphatase PhoE
MPTRVLLLRHAETANPAVFHGAESDIGLSERGRRQAEAIAALVAAERPSVLISSAMRRALETAGPIAAACGLSIRLEASLHERRVGALSGKSTEETGELWPGTLSRWLGGETAYAPRGAESFDDIRARVLPVWQRLTAEHAGETLCIVAHGVVCKVLLLSVLPGWSVGDWKRLGPIANCALHDLECDGDGWRGLRLNFLDPTLAAI